MAKNRKSFLRKNYHDIPGFADGVYVKDGNLERALKILKRKMKDSSKLLKVKTNRYFKSNTEKRIEKESKAKFDQMIKSRNELRSKKF